MTKFHHGTWGFQIVDHVDGPHLRVYLHGALAAERLIPKGIVDDRPALAALVDQVVAEVNAKA